MKRFIKKYCNYLYKNRILFIILLFCGIGAVMYNFISQLEGCEKEERFLSLTTSEVKLMKVYLRIGHETKSFDISDKDIITTILKLFEDRESGDFKKPGNYPINIYFTLETIYNKEYDFVIMKETDSDYLKILITGLGYSPCYDVDDRNSICNRIISIYSE